MKKVCLILAVSFVLCVPALAQQNPADAPATQADVEKYLETMHSREMMNQMIEAMAKPMQQMAHEQYLKHKDVLPPDFETRENKVMQDMLKEMPWEEMIQAMVPAYQKHFTKGDMDALIAFYSTPTGQKVLHEMPGLMADSMQAMMPFMQRHIEKITGRLQEEETAMLREAQKTHPSSGAVQKK
jgi:uncharacterized protein